MDTSRPCKPSRVRGRQCRCRGHLGPMAPRPRPPSVSTSSPPWTSPGLLHAVFRPKSDVRPVDLVCRLLLEKKKVIIKWIMDTARRSAKEAGRDPSELKFIVDPPNHHSDSKADTRQASRLV